MNFFEDYLQIYSNFIWFNSWFGGCIIYWNLLLFRTKKQEKTRWEVYIWIIGVAIYIFINAFKNLKSITDLFLEKKPDNISVDEIKWHILKIQGVIDIHHIHIRSIDGYYNITTFHVVVSEYSEKIKSKIKEELKEHSINHLTIWNSGIRFICHTIYITLALINTSSKSI